jgi:hypothetical protein
MFKLKTVPNICIVRMHKVAAVPSDKKTAPDAGICTNTSRRIEGKVGAATDS